MSGGGTGLMSGGGWSTTAGTPGGRGMSGFFGCSIMNLMGATALPPPGPIPVEVHAPTNFLHLGTSAGVGDEQPGRPAVRVGRRLDTPERAGRRAARRPSRWPGGRGDARHGGVLPRSANRRLLVRRGAVGAAR